MIGIEGLLNKTTEIFSNMSDISLKFVIILCLVRLAKLVIYPQNDSGLEVVKSVITYFGLILVFPYVLEFIIKLPIYLGIELDMAPYDYKRGLFNNPVYVATEFIRALILNCAILFYTCILMFLAAVAPFNFALNIINLGVSTKIFFSILSLALWFSITDVALRQILSVIFESDNFFIDIIRSLGSIVFPLMLSIKGSGLLAGITNRVIETGKSGFGQAKNAGGFSLRTAGAAAGYTAGAFQERASIPRYVKKSSKDTWTKNKEGLGEVFNFNKSRAIMRAKIQAARVAEENRKQTKDSPENKSSNKASNSNKQHHFSQSKNTYKDTKTKIASSHATQSHEEKSTNMTKNAYKKTTGIKESKTSVVNNNHKSAKEHGTQVSKATNSSVKVNVPTTSSKTSYSTKINKAVVAASEQSRAEFNSKTKSKPTTSNTLDKHAVNKTTTDYKSIIKTKIDKEKGI